MKTSIPCEKCGGLGLVRHYSLIEGEQSPYLTVARECPVCEGRGVLDPFDSQFAPTAAARPATPPPTLA